LSPRSPEKKLKDIFDTHFHKLRAKLKGCRRSTKFRTKKTKTLSTGPKVKKEKKKVQVVGPGNTKTR
jgi:hypothetical protein